MMEHIDDDDYFQKQLESKSALKRKPDETSASASPITVDDSANKKQRSVDDYCDDSDIVR
jgi:hypothetical protein